MRQAKIIFTVTYAGQMLGFFRFVAEEIWPSNKARRPLEPPSGREKMAFACSRRAG